MKEDIQNSENENLVTFPASKNFPEVAPASLGETSNPIDDLLSEIEDMELVFNNKNNELDNDIVDDFNFEFDEEILENRVFPKKKSIPHKISTLSKDESYLSSQASLDKVLEVMRTRIDELQECHRRVRFYVNEIKLNQK